MVMGVMVLVVGLLVLLGLLRFLNRKLFIFMLVVGLYIRLLMVSVLEVFVM